MRTSQIFAVLKQKIIQQSKWPDLSEIWARIQFYKWDSTTNGVESKWVIPKHDEWICMFWLWSIGVFWVQKHSSEQKSPKLNPVFKGLCSVNAAIKAAKIIIITSN